MKNKIIQLRMPNNRNIRWVWLIEIKKDGRYKIRYPKKNILINKLHKKNDNDFGPVKLAPKDSTILKSKSKKTKKLKKTSTKIKKTKNKRSTKKRRNKKKTKIGGAIKKKKSNEEDNDKGRYRNARDWVYSKMPDKPQFIKDIIETLQISTNLPQTIQNQMTIFLYGLKDIDSILIPIGSDGYDERNKKQRIQQILLQLRESPIFERHLERRNIQLGDDISSEKLWQILQQETIAKIINNFMKQSLINSE